MESFGSIALKALIFTLAGIGFTFLVSIACVGIGIAYDKYKTKNGR